MTTHTIKANEMEAIALAVSYEQMRYYLNGVCVETYKDGSCGMIATDGHRLHSINTQDTPVSSFIIASEDVQKILAMCKVEVKSLSRTLRDNLQIMVDYAGDNIVLSLMFDGVPKDSFITKPIDGNFPDWRRTFPSHGLLAEPVGFNAAYLTDFAKAAKLLSITKHAQLVIAHCGKDAPAVITTTGNDAFKGLLMPMRY